MSTRSYLPKFNKVIVIRDSVYFHFPPPPPRHQSPNLLKSLLKTLSISNRE